MTDCDLQKQIIDSLTSTSDYHHRHYTEMNNLLKTAKKERDFWKQLTNLLSTKQHVAALKYISKESKSFQTISKSSVTKNDLLIRIRDLCLKESKAYLNYFLLEIDELCASNDLNLHIDSKYPKFFFSDKFITLTVINDYEVSVESREGGKITIPLDKQTILENLTGLNDRLFNTKRDLQALLSSLFRIYKLLVPDNSEHQPTAVDIQLIISKLKVESPQFKQDEFIIDFSNLLASPNQSISGYNLDPQHTQDRKMGLLLHGKAATGLIGSIRFVKEGR